MDQGTWLDFGQEQSMAQQPWDCERHALAHMPIKLEQLAGK
jgi:hypothetical protein